MTKEQTGEQILKVIAELKELFYVYDLKESRFQELVKEYFDDRIRYHHFRQLFHMHGAIQRLEELDEMVDGHLEDVEGVL